jgi:hypothetical protein
VLILLALGSLVAGAATALLRAGAGTEAPAEPRGCWRLELPPGADFPADRAAAWIASLAPLLREGGPLLWAELRGSASGVALFVSAPPAWEGFLSAQLGAWVPGARLEPVRDMEPGGVLAAVPLRAERPDLWPLRTAGRRDPDPLLAVLGTLAEGESPAGLRVAWGPAPPNWKAWAPLALAAARTGRPLPPRGWRVWPFLLWQALRDGGAEPSRARALPAADLQPAAGKAREAVFAARALAWAPGRSAPEAERRAGALAAQAGGAFRAPLGNALVPAGRPRSAASWAELDGLRPPEVALSPAELGGLLHLPDHPHLPRGASRTVPPPEAVREAAREPAPGRVRLGEALAPDGPVPFGLGPAERRQHLYVVGKTGTGKSTLLAQIAKQDLEAGRGLALIDPHGDLAERVLALVPESRYGETVYFNPADREFPVPLNPLWTHAPAERPLAASAVVGVFRKLSGEMWGPRLENILRHACLALLENPAPSLAMLPRLLTDSGYRHDVLGDVRDPVVRGFFLQEYESYDPRWRAEAAAPVLTRVGQFLASPLVRNVVGAPGPGLDLRGLMDRGGILVANLSAGKLGEDSMALLGGLLVAGFQLAAMARADRPEGERRDFVLLVDEFQHFANDAFGAILSEARKYRLSLVLSHQYLDQLPAPVSGAVFGNVGSLAVFRVGQGDTARLVRELTPQFEAEDLVRLPDYRFCARIAHDGAALPAFSARTFPPDGTARDLGPLVERSRQRWGRVRAAVDLELADLWEGRASP